MSEVHAVETSASPPQPAQSLEDRIAAIEATIQTLLPIAEQVAQLVEGHSSLFSSLGELFTRVTGKTL